MRIIPSYGAPRNNRTRAYSLVASAMLVLMLTAQLYGYEDFSTILSGLLPINDERAISAVAGVIVFGELLALPYLLGMYLSRLMRVLSATTGFTVAGFWLLTALTNAHIENSGLFSDTIQLAGGILPAIWSVLLFWLIAMVVFADSRFRHAGS